MNLRSDLLRIQHFLQGLHHWWWNQALNVCNQTYKETGKGISRSGLNTLLPKLKKEHEWLKTDVYSQSLQQTSLNLSRAFINFFEKRAQYPKFKSKHGKQSVRFPQHVIIEVVKTIVNWSAAT